MLVGPGQPAGSGLRGQPRLYLSRARPLHTRPGGHLAGSAATAAQGDAARGGYCRAALGVPEPQPNFFSRGVPHLGAGGAGRGERSSWIAQQQRPHNMASSASSAAGAESTPPLAQVSAARPPYLWLPVRLGRAGNRGAREARAEGGGVSREPWTRRGAAGSPVLLGVRGCGAARERRAEGS